MDDPLGLFDATTETATGTEAELEELLDGAALLGAELDLTYRVLAVTVAPGASDRDEDRRQVLFHPVGRVAASLLLRTEEGRYRVARFENEQLLDVVTALDAPLLRSPMLGVDRPGPDRWGPEPSMRGAAQVGDGRARQVLLDVQAHDGTRFGLHATYDSCEVRNAAGEQMLTL